MVTGLFMLVFYLQAKQRWQEGDAHILALPVAASHLTPYDRLLLDIW